MLDWKCKKCGYTNQVEEVTREDVVDSKKKFKSWRLKCDACDTEHYVLSGIRKEVQSTIITIQ